MLENDVKWIIRKMLASALSADDGRVRNEIIHCVFIIRDRVLPELSFGKGARTNVHTWTTARDKVLTESMVLASTFTGGPQGTFAYRPSVNRVLDVFAMAESTPDGKQWWEGFKVQDTAIMGH